MNYIAIYKSITSSPDIDEKYSEKHHIIPRSIFNNGSVWDILSINVMGDVDQPENIIRLSARKHFIAHKLLVKIFRNVNSDAYIRMTYAMNFLNSRMSHNSRSYEWCRRSFSKMMSDKLTGKPSQAKGCKWSEKSKQRKSDTSPSKGKTYEEQFGSEGAARLKQMRSDSSSGRKHRSESIDKMKATEHTAEWNEKISKAKTGKPLPDSTQQKIRQILSNPDTHPSVDQTLHRFRHKTGTEVVCRCYDMKHIYDCKLIHRIMRDKTKSSRGWYYVDTIQP
jgi:hypothetical protein